MIRQAGYYWIKFRDNTADKWEIAEYRPWCTPPWWQSGDEIGVREEELSQVGNRLLAPDEYSPIDCVKETREHIKQVQNNLALFIHELLRRMRDHDDSKFSDTELTGFTEYSPRLKNSTYGSPEYMGFLEGLKEPLIHHYQSNRHHPEYYPDGYRDMNLIDLLEMLADWWASSKRHANGNIYDSIDVNYCRFNLSNDVAKILQNTVWEVFGVEGERMSYASDRQIIEDLSNQKNAAYRERNLLLVPLAKAAIAQGWRTGRWYRAGEEPGWGWIVHIEIPNRRADWHIHDSELPIFEFLPELVDMTWENYSNEEKYAALQSVEFK